MKAVILAGGLGSRLSEETVVRPKPMVEIGGKPILWHILNIYAAGGVREFVIACGLTLLGFIPGMAYALWIVLKGEAVPAPA